MAVASMLDPQRFDPMTPVLFARLSPAVRAGRREWIAWPTLVWRVVAPDPAHRRPLDVFQRAVLRLAEAGVRDAERTAALLGVEPDLTAHLAAGLQHAGLLDHRGACTPRGRRTLDDDEAAREAPLVSRHVFQDPWTGRLLDRACEHLEFAELDQQPGDWPRLRFGSRGNPRQRRAFFVIPRGAGPVPPPDARAVVDALVGHVHAARAHEAARFGDEAIDLDRPLDPLLSRVSVVDDAPRAAFLVTWLYLPASEDDPTWRIADPFGVGDAYALRAEIVERARSDRGLAGVVERLTGDAIAALADRLATVDDAIDQQARARIEQRLGLGVAGLPFERDLVGMERARVQLEANPSRAARAETAVLQAQRALEQAFTALLAGWRCPRDRVDRLSFEDRRRNAMLLDAIAADLGFSTPLPERLSRTTRGKVLSAITGGATLGRQIAAALIAAEAHPEHPLRRLASDAPELLGRLDALADARNRAAHARAREEALTPDALEDHIETTYDTLAALMPLVPWR